MADRRSRLISAYLEGALVLSKSDRRDQISVRCVNCGESYEFGVTYCWKCDTSLLKERNTLDNGGGKFLSESELKARLSKLELEYKLARLGLHWGGILAILSVLGGTLTGVGVFIAAMLGLGFLTGHELIFIYLTLALALIIYFSFVFGRAAKLKAEVSETQKVLEMSSGENVRE